MADSEKEVTEEIMFMMVCNRIGTGRSVSTIRNYRYSEINDLLTWNNTPQGADFWSKLYDHGQDAIGSFIREEDYID